MDVLKSAFSAENLRNREYDVCIVDEADNLLIDGASSPALISSNFPTKQAQQILEKVYQSVVSEKKDESQIKGILQEEFKESNVNEEELALMIEAAKKSQELKKGKDYILEKDKFWGNQVQIIDSNTGFKLSSSRWHAYVHEMVEIKEGIFWRPTSITKCAVSPMIFFGAYKNLLGVTGTTGNEKEEELFKNIYRLSTFKVPTHRELKRNVIIKLYDPETENLNELISKEALEESKKGRPVLVILDSINATNEMKEKYLRDANLIQGINVQADRSSIRNAGRSGIITASTIAAGRGTNIRLDPRAKMAGGLHVIVSKLPAQSRTLIQNIGRSSRQGQPGSATVYVRPKDKFSDISEMNPSTVNLFRLQQRFSEYIRNHWPWMIVKENRYTSESEYRFGADYDEILRTDAKIIVYKYFWPKKVLTNREYQDCLTLTKNMVLNAWGSMYTHLATSENGQDMEYCDQKYKELLRALNKWIPEKCPEPEEYIGCWAKEFGEDEEIFKFLYTHQGKMTIRDFLTELFKYKRVQIHADNAGYDIKIFDSMLKFMPEEHQKAYAALVSEENEYRRKLEKYNRDVVAYNEREAERARIAQENNQVYTKTITIAEKIHNPEKARVMEGPQLAVLPESAPAEEKGVGSWLKKTVDTIFIQAYAADYTEAVEKIPINVYLNVPDDGYHHVYKIGLGIDKKQAVVNEIDNRKNATGITSYNYILPEAIEGRNCYTFKITVSMVPLSGGIRYKNITETYKRSPLPLPESLPRPIPPQEPNWFEIGWEFLRGHSIDKVIWKRWFPPKAENYRGILCPCGKFAGLGKVNNAELDRIDRELRNIPSKRPVDITDSRRAIRYSMICEMLPEPIRKYRKVVHELIAENDSKNFGHDEDQIKLGGFPGAAMGFTVGLTRDLPRGIINDTLKLVLDPLGSLLELMDALDQNNPNNYVHQIEKAWQEGDSFSRGRIVGNTVGQVALAITPAIAKKFAKIPTELGEARAAEVKPGAASIAGESDAAAREAEVASFGARVAEEAGAEARTDFYVKPSGELIPGSWLIHGELRNLRVHPGRQGKHILGHNNYKVKISKGKTPSVFYGTIEDAQRLVYEFAGKGQLIRPELERVNFKKVIGLYVDENTGDSLETTWGTIRYSKDGVHIVPSKPDSY